MGLFHEIWGENAESNLRNTRVIALTLASLEYISRNVILLDIAQGHCYMHFVFIGMPTLYTCSWTLNGLSFRKGNYGKSFFFHFITLPLVPSPKKYFGWSHRLHSWPWYLEWVRVSLGACLSLEKYYSDNFQIFLKFT